MSGEWWLFVRPKPQWSDGLWSEDIITAYRCLSHSGESGRVENYDRNFDANNSAGRTAKVDAILYNTLPPLVVETNQHAPWLFRYSSGGAEETFNAIQAQRIANKSQHK